MFDDNGATRLVTLKEAAEILRVHPDTVMKFIQNNNLRAKQLPNGHWRISYVSVMLLVPTSSTESCRNNPM